MEGRPITTNESTEFLRILVDAFNLDFGRAKQAFFADPAFDLNRKWALFDEGEMRAILTTAPMQFGWGKAIGIAGVATREEHRGKGYAEQLMRDALRQSERDGEGAAMLFAHRSELYERLGFFIVDHVVRAPLLGGTDSDHSESLTLEDVQDRYNAWAKSDVRRLRRSEVRWQYWKWFHRRAEPFGDGYVCVESPLVREVVPGVGAWPVGTEAEWYGLRSLAQELGLQLGDQKEELLVMSRGMAAMPQMFMTDQF